MSGFKVGNLFVLAYAGGFTSWHYRAEGHSVADVLSKGFFIPAADMFAAGDQIHVSNPDGAIILHVGRDMRMAVMAAAEQPSSSLMALDPSYVAAPGVSAEAS